MKTRHVTSESSNLRPSFFPEKKKTEPQHRDDTYVLICPAERPNVSALAETSPLVNVCILGKPFLHHWLEHLAERGAREIKILAVDRPEQVREVTGDGARWGLQVEIIPESHELSLNEARAKYLSQNSSVENTGARRLHQFNENDLPGVPALAKPKKRHRHASLSAAKGPSIETASNGAPGTLALMDHLPGFPEQKLFESYRDFFSATQIWFSRRPETMQIGMKQIEPGVWIGLRTRISHRAKLHAPCWIGENVIIKADAEIGPRAVLENSIVVENAAGISESWIGPQTFVGSLTEIKDSLAFANTLVNFRANSFTKIADAFLLCALRDRKTAIRSGHLPGRIAALLAMLATFPFALITILKARFAGHRLLRRRRAAPPQFSAENSPAIVYFEFANANGWWKRWPQLWNVARGEFTWIGNRPLTPIEAGKLTNDFERLWLASPIGLISQSDAEGCADISSDEARAHSSFYSAQANWRLDFKIFFRALFRLARRRIAEQTTIETAEFKTRAMELERVVTR